VRERQELYDKMIEVMDELQGQCIYCTLAVEGQLHAYHECRQAEAGRCGYTAYQRWQEGVDLGTKHCWECGLSQSICRRWEQAASQQVQCEYE